MDMLDGMFSFVLLDTRDNSYIVARDAIGITSLYIGWGLDGNNVSFIVFLISSFPLLWIQGEFPHANQNILDGLHHCILHYIE